MSGLLVRRLGKTGRLGMGGEVLCECGGEADRRSGELCGYPAWIWCCRECGKRWATAR